MGVRGGYVWGTCVKGGGSTCGVSEGRGHVRAWGVLRVGWGYERGGVGWIVRGEGFVRWAWYRGYVGVRVVR